jgi:hypothetical protein
MSTHHAMREFVDNMKMETRYLEPRDFICIRYLPPEGVVIVSSETCPPD